MTWLHQPRVIVCDHPTDGYVCAGCVEEFEWCLGDIPALVEDLEIALVKDVRFPAHGFKKDDTDRIDESPLPYNHGASACLAQLGRVLRGDPVRQSRKMLSHMPDVVRKPDVGEVIESVSRTAAWAHRIIDRPVQLVYFGPCFGDDCALDLWAPRDTDRISCRCGYTSEVAEHRLAIIDSNRDRWLTVDELVGVLTQAGQPASRSQITKLVYRKGLPRERQNKVRWVDDRIVSTEVWVHRLADVLDLMEDALA